MLHCSGSFEFSSETNKSILFESQVEEKKVESPLADYNSPSPIFSVENTKPLISGFVASTMGTCVSLQSAVFLLPLHSTCKPDG